MKQVHLNFGEGFSHDFNIETEKKKNKNFTKLVRTTSTQWTKDARGKVTVDITDDGSGLEIEFERGTKISLDYDEAEELFILLTQLEFTPFEIKETKTTFAWPSSQ
jgi:hypothetical protein